MQETIEHQWLKDTDFKDSTVLIVRIVEYIAVGKDRLMIFTLPNSLETRQMSVWGENKNVLIRAFGPDTSAWHGQTVRISESISPEGKRIRKLGV